MIGEYRLTQKRGEWRLRAEARDPSTIDWTVALNLSMTWLKLWNIPFRIYDWWDKWFCRLI
jgi:hypothetical protein